jgi:hypothetical protein
MSPSLELPPRMEANLTALVRLSARDGYHFMAVSLMHAGMRVLIEAYLGKSGQDLNFRELVDAVESDRLEFRGKADLLRRLRELDASVVHASSAPDYEEANRILKPRVRYAAALYRRTFHSMFDISRLDEKRAGERGQDR